MKIRRPLSVEGNKEDAFEYFLDNVLHDLQKDIAVASSQIVEHYPHIRKIAPPIQMMSVKKSVTCGFFMRFERCLATAKKLLIYLFQDKMHTLRSIKFENVEHLCEKLKCLCLEGTVALENEILDCYQYIMRIEETAEGEAQETIRQVGKIMEELARFSVVYKEYLRRKYKTKKKSMGFSERMAEVNWYFSENSESSGQQEEEMLEIIQKDVNKKHFIELVLSYVKSEEQKIEAIKEVCRICAGRFNVEYITEHVKYCHNKYLLQDNLENNTRKLKEVLAAAKEYLHHSHSANHHNQKPRRHSGIQLKYEVDTSASINSSQNSLDSSSNSSSTRNNRPAAEEKKVVRSQRRHLSLLLASKYEDTEEADEIIEEPEHKEKNLNKLMKKIVKYIEAITANLKGVFSTNREEKIYTSHISELLMVVDLQDNSEVKKFSELFHDRVLIQQKLKKIEADYFKVNNEHESSKRSSSNPATPGQDEEEKIQKIPRKSRFSENPSTNKITVRQRNNKSIQKSNNTAQIPRIHPRHNSVHIDPDQLSEDEEDDDDTPKNRAKSEKFIKQLNEFRKPSLKDFEILDFLGKGAFGKVYLVRRLMTNDQYAMKVVKISNEDIQNNENIAHEHDIFRKISGDFLVKAAFSFSEGDLHMFFLEYMKGGDFSQLLERQVYLEQEQAKFYIAEIVLAIAHLHNLNITHRDLKPQNLVLDEAGHLKLTDFGLSKEGIKKKMSKTSNRPQEVVDLLREQDKGEISPKKLLKKKTLLGSINSSQGYEREKVKIVGTPDYIAPEIITGQSVDNHTIDWWSLGVIVYQILVGERPFGDVTIQNIFDNIMNLRIDWPPIGYQQGMMTPEAQDLIIKLLNKDYRQRLGAKGVWAIKQHPFFEGIEWDKIKQTKPPIAPTLRPENYLHERKDLRNDIEQIMIRRRSAVPQGPLIIQLNNLVRVDILLEETLKAGENTRRKKEQQLAYFSEIVQKYEEDEM